MQGTREHLNRLMAIAIVSCLCSCAGRKVTDAKGYIKDIYNKENGMIQSKSIEAIRYEAVYLPPSAMTISELKDSCTSERYDKLLPEYRGMQYVKFTIKADKLNHIYNAVRAEGKDPDRVEQYLNLNAQNDFMLISGNDTSLCGLYSFSKTYGLAYDWQLLLGFEQKDSTGDVYLQYDDKIAGNGTVSFKFSRNDIKKLPTINFSP